MTAFERQEESDAEAIRATLESLASFMHLWHVRFAYRHDDATLEELERLRDVLHSLQATMPEILDPTYHLVWRVLSDTEFALLQRDYGYDATALWDRVIYRGLQATGDIERMQRLAARGTS
jgi:primosomal protein N'